MYDINELEKMDNMELLLEYKNFWAIYSKDMDETDVEMEAFKLTCAILWRMKHEKLDF